MLELAWADALKGEVLIDEMLEINQEAYNHYAGSGKKKLQYLAVCSALNEDNNELISRHGIRWRESTHRASRNLLLSWKVRCTDLLEEASVEIGLTLTPLSPPELFEKVRFFKRTEDSAYGNGMLTFELKVEKHLGKEHGQDMFLAKYMRVRLGRSCRGETEKFSKGDLLMYLLDGSNQSDRLYSTDAGKLLKRMTQYKYVKTLAFWVDITAEGKAMSKLFQKSGVLLSDMTRGVEDSISAISSFVQAGGPYMNGFITDYDTANETLLGISVSDVTGGQAEYDTCLANTTSSLTNYLNDRFVTILKDPILRAACIFEHARWPSQ